MEELDFSADSRTGAGEIALCNGKSFELPAYFPKVRNAFELEKVILSTHERIPQIQGVMFDFTAQTSLKKYFSTDSGPIQQTLPFLAESPFTALKKNSVIMFDPSTEYLYYNVMPKKDNLINILPDQIKKRALNIDQSKHYPFWNNLRRTGRLAQVAEWTVKLQSKMDADVIVPFAPFITYENPKKLLELAIRVNLSTKSIAQAHEKESALYLNIHDSLFAQDSFLEDMADRLIFDEIMADFNLILLKIKNYNFNQDDIKRDNFKRFLNMIRIPIEEEGKTIMLLDADTLGLVVAMAGLSGFVEPLDGSIRDYRGYGAISDNKQRGKYYHPETMTFLPYKEIRKIYLRNGKTLPCTCPACESINGIKDLDLISSREWNIKRRVHLLWARSFEIEEIRSLRRKGNLRGMSDKIIRSKLKNYIEILPNGII